MQALAGELHLVANMKYNLSASYRAENFANGERMPVRYVQLPPIYTLC